VKSLAHASLNPSSGVITAVSLELPEVEISPNATRLGSSFFSENSIVGFGVGIAVDEQGLSMGAPLPEGLAKFVVRDA
jgi:hypothetical protein